MWGRGFSVFSLRFPFFFLTHALKWPCKSVWVHCKTQTSLKVSFNILLLSLNLTSSLQLNSILLSFLTCLSSIHKTTSRCRRRCWDASNDSQGQVLCQQNDPNKVWHIPVADICGLLEADFTLSVYVRVYSYECVSTDANIPIKSDFVFFCFFLWRCISLHLCGCVIYDSPTNHMSMS